MVWSVNTYPLNCGLSSGQCYVTFEQPGAQAYNWELANLMLNGGGGGG